MNIHIYTTNTLYPILQSPSIKKINNKHNSLVYRIYTINIYLYTRDTLYPILQPLHPPK